LSLAGLSIRLTYPVEIAMTNVLFVAAPPKYVTDSKKDGAGREVGEREVVTLDDGAPGRPDLTEAQADAAVMREGYTVGARVQAGQVVQTGKPTDSYDCHGLPFTGSARWINNDQVQKILDDNGYAKRDAGKVQVGDLVVYRNGGIRHTGIVTKVAGGNAVEIESKWGRAGQYKHRPQDVPASYGMPEYQFSARANGHLLNTK
jgi:hypothetical protein